MLICHPSPKYRNCPPTLIDFPASPSSPLKHAVVAHVRTHWATRFTTLFSQSIYKWVQSPLSLHVGSLDLDRERALQLPVVQKNEWF